MKISSSSALQVAIRLPGDAPREREFLMEYITEEEHALQWVERYPQDKEAMLPYLREEKNIYRVMCLFPEEAHKVLGMIRSPEYAYYVAQSFPAYRREMREIVKQSPEWLRKWVTTFPWDTAAIIALARAKDEKGGEN